MENKKEEGILIPSILIQLDETYDVKKLNDLIGKLYDEEIPREKRQTIILLNSFALYHISKLVIFTASITPSKNGSSENVCNKNIKLHSFQLPKAGLVTFRIDDSIFEIYDNPTALIMAFHKD
jgi:hypothetical protein